MFESIFTTTTTTGLTFGNAAICIVSALIMGAIIAIVHMKTSKYTKNFVISIAVLPALVELAIMMVNGNLGTAVSIMGIFGLIRFRSIEGNSKEIISVFFAMVIGLAVGMGHIAFAATVTLVVSLIMLIYNKIPVGSKENERNLKIVIPENLNYTNVFDEIFSEYTVKNELQKVKTTNMGSMYELSYVVEMKKDADEKKFLDDLRVRNGNLNIIMSKNLDDQAL
ncbi:MAG: DUF4956 domain-containing protein [Clostridia bacterium]|nr:DUF4956 domain-containing protein [Clostridia bacterium]